VSETLALALLASIAGGSAVVFRYLTGRITKLEDRLFKSMDLTDESLDTAEAVVRKKPRSA
jgi:hypothetical protein